MTEPEMIDAPDGYLYGQVARTSNRHLVKRDDPTFEALCRIYVRDGSATRLKVISKIRPKDCRVCYQCLTKLTTLNQIELEES